MRSPRHADADSLAAADAFLRGEQLLRRGERACGVVGQWGETSSDTDPSTPAVRSWIGRERSAARVRSSRASSKKSSSPRRPFASFSAMAVALSASVLYRVVEIVGFEVSPVTDSSSM